jgi:hypothetical protein
VGSKFLAILGVLMKKLTSGGIKINNLYVTPEDFRRVINE